MQDFINILTSSSSDDFVGLFIKAFAVMFAFIYLLYAVVTVRQTQIMNNTFSTKMSSVLASIAFIQIIFAGILILVALLFI